MGVGFVHGVMNTDNFSISGETIDYGPCAFLDEYHPGKVFSSIDQNGRYAFGNQPSISAWNLASLAGCLIAFIDKDSDKANELATEVLDNFSVETNQRILNLMCQKIGLDGSSKENQEILRRLLKIMMDNEADYTITFRSLSKIIENDTQKFLSQFKQKTEVNIWIQDWQNAIEKENKEKSLLKKELDAVNPVFIPRNHLIQKAIDASYEGNYDLMKEMIKVSKTPFDGELENSVYAEAPSKDQRVTKTFCGT